MEQKDLNELKDILEMHDLFINHDFFGPHPEKFENFLEKTFSSQSDLSRKLWKQVEITMDLKPEFFVDLGEAIGKEYQVINHLLLEAKASPRTPLDKIRMIKIFWEMSRFFRPVAVLLTGHKSGPEHLEDHDAVYKHLIRHFGFKKTDIEVIRKIRNSYSHQITLGNNCVIIKMEDESRFEVSLNDIENIFTSLDKMFSWWSTAFITLIWTHPGCGLIVLIGFFKGMKMLDASSVKNWIETLVILNPELNKLKSGKVSVEAIDKSTETPKEFSKNEKVLILEGFRLLNLRLKPFVSFLRDISTKVNRENLPIFEGVIDFFETLESKSNEFAPGTLDLIRAFSALRLTKSQDIE